MQDRVHENWLSKIKPQYYFVITLRNSFIGGLETGLLLKKHGIPRISACIVRFNWIKIVTAASGLKILD